MALPVQSGLVLRVESDRGLATDGTRVTSWDDTSGLGNNLAALGDPTLAAAATPSGAPAIVFDGVGDLLQRVNATDTLNGLPAGAADRTMFFVVNYIDAEGTTSGLVYGDGAKNEAFGLATKNTDQDLLLQGWGGSKFDFDSNVDGPTQGWMVQSVVLKAGMFSHYLDGAEIQSGAHTFATDLKQLVIGGEIAGLGESALEVGAALIYDRALTEPERLQVESFLQSKYLVDDGLNDAPVAVGETAFVIPGGTVAIDILDNDIDDGPLDGASVEILDEPEFGSIAGVDPTTGAVTYVSTASEPTSDSFTYTLTDADGVVSQPATVSISVETAPLSLDGFADDQVLTRAGMNADSPFFLPISMTFLPDNRMLLLSKDGEILIVDPESGASSSFMRLNNIDTGQERGLLDITLDPDFAENGYFYLYYTPDNPEHARISRFTYEENSGGLTATGDVSSEVLVWEDTDGYLSCCHYGGGLDFGPDDKLWLTTSDKFQASTPGEGAAGGSDLPLVASSSSGKVIRVNPDGTAPDGADGQPANPWADPNDGINDYVWGYGLRNPFRARWDEEYGNFYIAEVGGNQQLIAEEDLHIASLDAPGAFFGWPFYEGVDGTYVNGGKSVFNPDNYPDPNGGDGPAYPGDFYSAPIWSLPHEGAVFDPNLNTSASLTGGEVYRGDMFPTEWDGVYFYGDYTRDYIRYLVLDETGTEILGDHAFKPSPELPGTTNEVVSIAVGEDGALYYAMIASGEIRRVTYSDGAMNDAPEIVAAGLTPATGDLPLTVTFSATVVDDENDPMTYTINFGDGSAPATGVVAGTGMISVDHTYASGGNYAVSFGVSDPGHKTWFAPLQVAAGDANAPPEVIDESASPTVAEANVTEVTFSATAFDPDEDQLTYTWFFGDGGSASGTAETGETITATHVYSFDGAYSAYLQINDGEFTDLSETLNVQVGEPTEVPVTDGLNLLLQSDIKIGLGVGNTVAAWLDGSGQGNNLFAQGDPTLEQNRTPTGQPAIVFDGVGDLLQRVNATDTIFNLPTGAADRTMFLVVKYIDAEGVASGLVYGDGAQNEAFGLTTRYNDNDLLLQGWGASNDFDSNVDGPTQGWLVQSVVLKAGAFSHYLDGAVIQSGAHTFATDLKQLVIGGEIAGLGESALEVGAALIYDRALTEPERLQVESFLQTKYITGSGGANTPPVAQDDSFTVAEDTQLAGDVLADNGAGIDADGDGDALQATLVSGPSNGDLTLNPNGTFTYTPDLNFDASDSFVYQISDGAGGVDQATATIDITPVDDPAVANDDAYTTTQGAALVVGPGSGVLSNDSDPENDPFTVTGVTDSPDSGALSWTPDGGFTYTPTSGFVGTDSFTYQITGGDTAVVTVNVTGSGGGVPVTAGLVAAYEDENVSLGAGNTVTGWLDGSGRGNDLVASGDPTRVENATPTGQSAIVFDGVGDLLQRVNATDTLNGLPAGAADRTMFFVVNYIDAEGTTSGLVYGDGAKNEAFGLATKHSDDDLLLQGWGGSKFDFDSNVDGPTQGWLVQSVVLKAGAFSHYLDGAVIQSGAHTFATDLKQLVIGAEIAGLGESELEVGAALIYDRALTEPERLQVESYLQTKYITGSGEANTPPVAQDDSFTMAEDTQLAGDVLADNGAGIDADGDGDALQATLVSGPSNGDLTLNPNGTFTYTPDLNFDASDSFVYQISDGAGGVDQATATIDITPVDDPAVANDDAYTTAQGAALVVGPGSGVLFNDSDPENDPFTVTGVTDSPDSGALSWTPDGGFTYTPTSGFVGTDSFTYQITGGDTAVVTVNVTGSGGGVPVTAGLVAAYEDENVSLGAGNTVTGWLDGSGRGNDLVASGDPTRVENATPTGQSAIVFDGVGDLLQRVNATDTLNGLPAGAADRTMFFVVNYIDAEGTTSGLVYGDGAKNEAFGLATKHSDDDLLLQGWGGSKFDFDSNVDGPTQGWLVQSVVLKAGAFSHYLDGAVIQSGAHTFATDLKQLVIGAEIAGLGESELEVGAALIYDRALTEPERLQVESYLQTKYITGSGEANLLAAAVSAVDTAPEDPALLADAAPDASFNDSAPENAPHEAAGSGGDDMLYARSGGDWLDGGAGNDHLFDGQGSDTMIGGAGADEFVFHGNHNNAGERDLVADLNFADDDRLVFVEFDPGTFNPDDKNTVEEGAGASVLSVEGLLGLDDLSGVSLHRLGEAHALLRMDPDMGGASEIELMFGGASAAEFEMRWLGA